MDASLFERAMIENPPKRRGRPPGSKNKKSPSEPTERETPSDAPLNPLHLFRAGSKLSDGEAQTLRPLLIEAFTGYTDYADDTLSRTNRKGAEAHIWSTMDDGEIATIVDTILSGGRKSAQIAFVAREMVRTYRLVKVGLILVPRFLATMQFYAENGLGLYVGVPTSNV